MTTAIRGARVLGLPRRSRLYMKGRTCAYSGCSIQISIYNRATTCFAHSEVKVPRLRGRKNK